MESIKKCVIILMSPTHIIPSLCAINTLSANTHVSVDIVVHNPAISDELNEVLAGVISELCRSYSFIDKIIAITSCELRSFCGIKNVSEASFALRRILSGNEYSEIYYAHDVMGFLYQLMSTTYRSAKRICYGDGLGTVFDKKFKLELGSGLNKHNILEKILRKSRLFIRNIRNICSMPLSTKYLGTARSFPDFFVNQQFRPDLACLVIPIDYSGSFLKNIPLVVCNKNLVLDIVNQIGHSCDDLDDYIQSLLRQFESRNKVLLLTENFAEAKRISFDREIRMWCSIVNCNAEPGSVVFLKSHPGELLPRNKAIQDELSDNYEIITLNSDFFRYPIELWKELVLNSKVLSMSYPCISLKYLYGIDTVNSFTNDFIEEWFPQTSWKLYKHNMKFFSEPVERLGNWDGNTVIWSGKYYN